MRRALLRGALLATVAAPAALAQPAEVPALPMARASASATSYTTPPIGMGHMTPVNAPSEARQAVPRSMPPSVSPLSPDKPLTSRERVVVRKAMEWRERRARAVVDADGWVHFQFGNGQPFVVCSPLHICDIELQPGEHVLGPPDLSDPRWIVHPRQGFEHGQIVTHVIVKPADNGLDANIVIHTDRRTYSIDLVSHSREYMPLVKFDYPDDESVTASEWGTPLRLAGAAGSTEPCDRPPIVPPSAFRISGPREAWTPVQVYVVSTDVGEKTCIEFASDIGSRALPALVALGNDGGWFSDPTKQIVNFRYRHHRFVVDEALDRFALVSGVGGDQQKVVVRRAGQ